MKDKHRISQSQTSTVMAQLSHSGAYQIRLVAESHARRSEVECFIAAQFLSVHNAHVTSFMPVFLVMFAADDSIRAAIGVRDANDSLLFLEYYFDQPIETIITDQCHEDPIQITRKGVIEVGNLASVDRFASRRLFESLASFLVNNRFQWIVFTGCSSLRRLFKRMQLELVELGEAKESSLPEGPDSWGQYYKDSPKVMLGHLSDGVRLAKQAAYLIPMVRS